MNGPVITWQDAVSSHGISNWNWSEGAKVITPRLGEGGCAKKKKIVTSAVEMGAERAQAPETTESRRSSIMVDTYRLDSEPWRRPRCSFLEAPSPVWSCHPGFDLLGGGRFVVSCRLLDTSEVHMFTKSRAVSEWPCFLLVRSVIRSQRQGLFFRTIRCPVVEENHPTHIRRIHALPHSVPTWLGGTGTNPYLESRRGRRKEEGKREPPPLPPSK